MVELAGISPFGGGGVNVRPNSEPVSQAVPAVEPASAGQGLSGRMSSGHSQTDGGAQRQAEQRSAYAQKKKVDKHAVPGPPPTFQITLLEMDRDLKETLARLNAAHSMPRDSAAVAGAEIAATGAANAENTPTASDVEQAEPAPDPAAAGTEPEAGYSAA